MMMRIHTLRREQSLAADCDMVRYALGFGALGELAHRAVVRRDLEAIFAYPAERVPALLS